MTTFVKYINEFEVMGAPTSYEGISNFNLDEELMIQYGFYPLTIVNPEELIKYPVVKYENNDIEKKVIGTRINKEPSS